MPLVAIEQNFCQSSVVIALVIGCESLFPVTLNVPPSGCFQQPETPANPRLWAQTPERALD